MSRTRIDFLKTFLATLLVAIVVTDSYSQQPPKLRKPDHASGRSSREANPNSHGLPVPGIKQHIESFELIWKTIRDTHWDPDKVGEEWAQHRVELLPKIQAASSAGKAREVITELIGRLGQSHFGIIPSTSFQLIGDHGLGGGNFDVGIDCRLIDGELVVTRVRDGSSASQTGIKPGWALQNVRGKNAGELISGFEAARNGPQRVETTAGLTMDRVFSGRENERVSVAFMTGDGAIRNLSLLCETPPGSIAKLGHLPPMRVIDETKMLEGGVGYFRFNAFLDPVRMMPAYQTAVRNPANKSGMVIDLRGNVGGLAAMTVGMAGELVDDQIELGQMTMRETTLKFVVNPRGHSLRVPLAILVDECSISSAEIFAGGLQDNEIARIFGGRTAGLAYPSVVIKLPNGDGFQYAIADYHSVNGQRLEKKGVVPDTEVKVTKRQLLEQGDPVLATALSWLKQSKK